MKGRRDEMLSQVCALMLLPLTQVLIKARSMRVQCVEVMYRAESSKQNGDFHEILL
jgi:hypothetical protein